MGSFGPLFTCKVDEICQIQTRGWNHMGSKHTKFILNPKLMLSWNCGVHNINNHRDMIQNRAPQTHRTAIQRLQKNWMNFEVKNDIIES